MRKRNGNEFIFSYSCYEAVQNGNVCSPPSLPLGLFVCDDAWNEQTVFQLTKSTEITKGASSLMQHSNQPLFFPTVSPWYIYAFAGKIKRKNNEKKAPAPEHRVDVAFNTVSFASFFSLLLKQSALPNKHRQRPTNAKTSEQIRWEFIIFVHVQTLCVCAARGAREKARVEKLWIFRYGKRRYVRRAYIALRIVCASSINLGTNEYEQDCCWKSDVREKRETVNEFIFFAYRWLFSIRKSARKWRHNTAEIYVNKSMENVEFATYTYHWCSWLSQCGFFHLITFWKYTKAEYSMR